MPISTGPSATMRSETGRTRAGARAPLLDDVRLDFDGSLLGVREVLARVMRSIDILSLDPEEKGSVELVLAEALNNVVEHAYRGAAERPVHLELHHAADGLHVLIRDSGRPMPEERLPLSDLSTPDGEGPDAPEGGFGWFIIRHIARDIAYRRRDAENVLTFRVAVGLDPTLHWPCGHEGEGRQSSRRPIQK